MRFLPILFISFLLAGDPGWQTDFTRAKQQAQSEHKFILLNFSGSDWCGPCISLRKDIFESSVFMQYADDHLVLVNADFPRLKKHRLPAEQQAKNDKLADVYNKEGIFPLTLLLAADGRVMKIWHGYPGISAEAFTNEIKDLIHDTH